MSASLPYVAVNSNFNPQRFGLELTSSDQLPFIQGLIICPAGYLRQWQSFSSMEDCGSRLTHQRNGLKVQLDVQQFEPNELHLKVEKGVVVVEGQHDEKEDGQGYISRRFLRRYCIPRNSDTARIDSTLSTDGILTINIPQMVQQERIIPIQLGIPQADAA